MGKIYESIRKDIEKLRKIDQAIQNHEVVSMDDVYDVSVALQKINYVIGYTEQQEPALLSGTIYLPNGSMNHFNIPENFEDMVDEWEAYLGEERANHALNNLRIYTENERLIPEITPHNPTAYYNYVRGALDNIAQNSQSKHFGITRDGLVMMTLSAHQNFVQTALDQDYAFDPKKADTEEIHAFLQDPVTQIVNAHADDLLFEDAEQRRDFIENREDIINEMMERGGHRNALEEIENHYPIARGLVPIHRAHWDTAALSAAIRESVDGYMKQLRGAKNNIPSLGAFLSDARDCIESSVFDHAMVLGDDPNSTFIKNFLKNPVDAMEKDFLAKAENQKGPNSGMHRRTAEDIRREMGNYNQARVGKTNRYVESIENRKRRTEQHLRELNVNLDPAHFKAQYQGSAFERFLGKTSQEWTELSDHIDSWKNAGADRDYDKAADLAVKYLRHKFPNVEPKDITEEMCHRLRGAGRERGLFCLALLESKGMADEAESQAVYDQANNRFTQLENRARRQEDFQQSLANDIENDNLIQQPEHNANEIVHENVIDKSANDKNEAENNNIIPNDLTM